MQESIQGRKSPFFLEIRDKLILRKPLVQRVQRSSRHLDWKAFKSRDSRYASPYANYANLNSAVEFQIIVKCRIFGQNTVIRPLLQISQPYHTGVSLCELINYWIKSFRGARFTQRVIAWIGGLWFIFKFSRIISISLRVAAWWNINVESKLSYFLVGICFTSIHSHVVVLIWTLPTVTKAVKSVSWFRLRKRSDARPVMISVAPTTSADYTDCSQPFSKRKTRSTSKPFDWSVCIFCQQVKCDGIRKLQKTVC